MDEPQPKVNRRHDEPALLRRALVAYHGDRTSTGWPDAVESGVERHAQLNFVCLRNTRGRLLAVYRLRRETAGKPGQLKRLVRWPWSEESVEE